MRELQLRGKTYDDNSILPLPRPLEGVSDDALMARLAKDKNSPDGQQAFTTLQKKHERYVFAIANRTLPSSEVDDASQRVWMRVFESAHNYESDPTNPNRFRNWLIMVSKQEIARVGKKHSSRREILQTDMDSADVTDRFDVRVSSARQEGKNEFSPGDARRLRAAITHLPIGVRELYQAVLDEELTVKDAGERLGLSRATAHARMVQANDRLKQMMESPHAIETKPEVKIDIWGLRRALETERSFNTLLPPGGLQNPEVLDSESPFWQGFRRSVYQLNSAQSELLADAFSGKSLDDISRRQNLEPRRVREKIKTIVQKMVKIMGDEQQKAA